MMDPAGAAALRERLEQQQHWRLAPAVLEGRLPRSDPDAPALREIRGDERLYEAADGPFVKRLIDGAWARFESSGPGRELPVTT
jgi:hypothetical protein